MQNIGDAKVQDAQILYYPNCSATLNVGLNSRQDKQCFEYDYNTVVERRQAAKILLFG